MLYLKLRFNWASYILSGNPIQGPKVQLGKIGNNGINEKSKRRVRVQCTKEEGRGFQEAIGTVVLRQEAQRLEGTERVRQVWRE